MFPMVEMSRLTVAAPLDSMDDVLAACDALGCVHVQPYEQFEEGIGVGQAAAQEGRGELLTNVRAVRAATSAVNTGGAMPRKQVEGLIDGSFPGRIEKVMEHLRAIDEAKASIQSLAEERDVMARLAPLEAHASRSSTGRPEPRPWILGHGHGQDLGSINAPVLLQDSRRPVEGVAAPGRLRQKGRAVLSL